MGLDKGAAGQALIGIERTANLYVVFWIMVVTVVVLFMFGRSRYGRAVKAIRDDEIAAGMNPTETEDLLHCINTIRDRFGIAILLIEHDMSLVMSVCQRIQVLDYGRTIASGTPEEIANNPQVISAYLGSDNNEDSDGHSTTKAEPEPSIAKTLTEGAR